MLCPACSHAMTVIDVTTTDNQETQIDECYYCGGHFLPSLIANFITAGSAKNLDSILPQKSANQISAPTLLCCPVCKETMTSVRDDSVPGNVTIYACPENHGDFFPKGQFYAFKQAQKTKIDFHRVWGVPVKSIFAILLPVTLFFTAITLIPLTLDQAKQSQETRISADSPLSNPLIVNLDSQSVIISFSTKLATTSSLTLNTDFGPQIYDVSLSPVRTHTITLTNLKPSSPYTYTIKTPSFTSLLYSFSTTY